MYRTIQSFKNRIHLEKSKTVSYKEVIGREIFFLPHTYIVHIVIDIVIDYTAPPVANI